MVQFLLFQRSIPACTGEPYVTGGMDLPRGSIPACTGEPSPSAGQQRQGWVYPRVYGGTQRRRLDARLIKGLSPRVRGNPGVAVDFDIRGRSIPACTGEPNEALPFPDEDQVYPRVYGEPRPSNGWWSPIWVYPRVYGGTVPSVQNHQDEHGLSPRVRGNRWK